MLPGKAMHQVILPCLLNYILHGSRQWMKAYSKHHQVFLYNICLSPPGVLIPGNCNQEPLIF
jgi:hypothetical protein